MIKPVVAGLRGDRTEESPKTFVLVHGAWHGGWCWTRVTERLRGAGHRVFTPTLTGLGDRAHLLSPQVSLDTFIQDIVATLEMEELTHTILVGHSFAGAPITGAADRVPERIAHLVYLDAALPQNGENVFSRFSPQIVAERQKLAQGSSSGLTLPAPPPSSFGVEAREDVTWLERRLRPQPFRGYQDPLRLQHPFGNGRKITYIACVKPAYPPVKVLHEYARNQPGWQYLELATGHDAMVLVPAALSDMLLQVAS
jgi:pimeloyl-ACP methyl ester carboxylesterase